MKKIKSIIIKFLESDAYRDIRINLNKIQSYKYKEKFEKVKEKKKIIYLLSPRHGNLGDQAIAYASLKFLKDNFSEYEIVELERDEIYTYYKAIKDILNKDDIIVLHGGGNLGNLYLREENVRRFIIKNFQENKLLSMTQTISFSEDEEGKKELEKTKKIYNENTNLTLLAREDKSYNKMKEVFTNPVFEVPDIVFYLENMYQDNLNDRDGIMTCLRADIESIWAHKKERFLKDLEDNYNNVFCYDTVVYREIPEEERENELLDIWGKYRKHKVVITDRLHGMIFAYITKTPCIVLKSLDHKVVESYKWIKNVDYIKLVDDLEFDKIKVLIDEMMSKKCIENYSIKDKYFPSLIENLTEILRNK